MKLQRVKQARLILRVSAIELDWVKHAAKLRHVSMAEYVKRAIDASLRSDGVDAVLLSRPVEARIERGAMRWMISKTARK